jgi:hypothetical protein
MGFLPITKQKALNMMHTNTHNHKANEGKVSMPTTGIKHSLAGVPFHHFMEHPLAGF